jgi:hypothetical protein
MNASEARTLTEKACNSSSSIYLTHAYEHITKQASNGLSMVSLKSPDSLTIGSVMDQLRKDGYKVERNNGYDQRDGTSWDFLNISW